MVAIKTLDILQTLLSAAIWYYKPSASKEIKKAEKIFANYQTSKLLGKPGTSGNKEGLIASNSESYNAFITGVTAYNVQDATIRAFEVSAKDHRKRVIAFLILKTLFVLLSCILRTQLYKVPFIVGIAATSLILRSDDILLASHLISMISSLTFLSASLEVFYCIVAYIKVVPSDIKWINAVAYATAKLILTLL